MRKYGMANKLLRQYSVQSIPHGSKLDNKQKRMFNVILIWPLTWTHFSFQRGTVIKGNSLSLSLSLSPSLSLSLSRSLSLSLSLSLSSPSLSLPSPQSLSLPLSLPSPLSSILLSLPHSYTKLLLATNSFLVFIPINVVHTCAYAGEGFGGLNPPLWYFNVCKPP